MNATATTYRVSVNGVEYAKRAKTKAYPFAIVQTWQEPVSDTEWLPRLVVSFAGDLAKAEREVATRQAWMDRDTTGRNYRLEILPTTAG